MSRPTCAAYGGLDDLWKIGHLTRRERTIVWHEYPMYPRFHSWLRRPAPTKEHQMAVQTPIPVHFDQVFPHKAYLTSEVEPMYTFVDGQRGAQDIHPITGEPMWQVTVLDADPNAKGAAKT